MRRKEKFVRVGTVSEFMRKEHQKKEDKKKERNKANKVAAALTLFPLATFTPYLATKAFAAESVNSCGEAIAVTATQSVVPVNAAGAMIGKTSLSAITHALDPVFQLLTALAFPVCSLVIVGSLFYLAFGNTEKAWSGVQRGALSYVLIQLSPILLKVLEQIGNAL